ncbi:hypothetical protein [Mannheimia sp. USDA-ARS-USMARC-1261]|nr:hypothetical protein [Mannheimia sp. USDA-ARS-USMARC-1261]
MFGKIRRSPALWLGMVGLNACSYIKNTDSVLIMLSTIVILEKENE